MTFTRSLLLILLVLLAIFWRRVLFVGGGGLVSLGHLIQGVVSGFDRKGEIGAPEEILERVLTDNEQASQVERWLGGPAHKPEVMIVMCMDPRLNSEVIVGDSRHYYDVVRLPGSVLSEDVIEAIELGVQEHRLKVVLLTTHTDCAMEKVAHSAAAKEYPVLSLAVQRREEMFQRLLQRPAIASRLQAGTLLVRRFQIDTTTGRLLPPQP
ncbi:MAG: hypothetical protein NZV14_00915 [Bryobacteraceae bacterium]|nr:hypothetical protein [Bryobacteraceae bacterium]MDW8376690.1 carbonic anhydrase [Bryobacterales bacterium]